MKLSTLALALPILFLSLAAPSTAADDSAWKAETFAGLELRGLGPALMSGRISDVARDPEDKSVWYVAAASGGLWKTENAGTTWTPVFENESVYSIGCVTVDPANPHVVWVGTGENNSQRSVGWGDGVYKSLDGGLTWTNTGLTASEHIGKIVVDPRDPDTVWAAAQGPLWAPGGDRGLYKTTDGGGSWELALGISENTGVSDVALDPRTPDVVYAASYQRRRRQWALVAGGPESRIFKSTDGGDTWRKLENGLPGGDVGRIGIALSPQDPDVVYATIAAADDESGFFRSSDRGESWRKMSDYVPVDPQYYMEIFPDPHRFDRVYLVDVWTHVSDDGGATFEPVNSKHKHVDNHAMLFDPDDPEYLMMGSDGGLYESWDRGRTWSYVDNLPITQFYRVGLDDALPFYNVYGGTQDNSSQGGPSRTTNVHGIRNSDWFVTVGGDGYQTRVEPGNPNIVYSLWQYGGLVRHDRLNGETLDIQPQPEPGDEPIVWNWDSPLMISPHSPTRLYFAGSRLFRSDDRGDTWRPVSPNLTRRIDRNRLEVMGTVWSVDSVWKNVFTSPYGSIVALDESPLVEGLLYAGTDDGLVQVSEDGGATWRGEGSFPGIPERTYVGDLTASLHDPDRVYALFNNHKSGDFSPYVLRSDDRGRTWTSIASNLPDDALAWSIVEDHETPELLFLGTEFALYFTRDGGGSWIELTGGAPTIAFRDLEIQRREDDLVAATFGRGFLVLDDYSPLRSVDDGLLESAAALFPTADATTYVPARPLGWGEKGRQGDGFYTAPNPPYGAVFTYYLGDGLESLRESRRQHEKELQEQGEPVHYPDWEDLRAEDREEAPAVVLVVADEAGRPVRRIEGPKGPGIHRVAWDLRYPSPEPVSKEPEENPWGPPPAGPLAAPGSYSVRLARIVGGELEWLSEPEPFGVVPLGAASLAAEDRTALAAFQRDVARLQRATLGTREAAAAMRQELQLARRALDATDANVESLVARARDLQAHLDELDVHLLGDRTVSSRREPTLPSLVDRVDRVTSAQWGATSSPTTTHERLFEIASTELAELLEGYREIREGLEALQIEMEALGAPWIPGRGLPEWP